MLLRDTVNLPIFDLNYLAGTERVNLFSGNSPFKRRGLLICTALFAYKLCRSALTWQPFSIRKIPSQSILFVAETKNQLDALNPIMRELDCALLDIGAGQGIRFPTFLAFLAALFFWPIPLLRYFTATPHQKISYNYVFHDYWLTYGFYMTARLWLRQKRPALVFVANDHNMRTRTVVQAAHDEGISTAYAQHASVSEKFPPLHFTYAFLDGKDALEKYAAIGASNTLVFLVGIPKFDAFLIKRNQHDQLDTLGVCINLLDPTENVMSLCQKLRERFPQLPIIFRAHPSDKRNWEASMRSLDIQLSHSKAELSFNFLQCVDVIIAGDSNISLEALLMNVVPLYYDFSMQGRDNYGFVKRRVVQLLASDEEVFDTITELLAQKPEVRHQAEFYSATINTDFDGRSSTLIAELVREITSGHVDYSAWARVERVPTLAAYELPTRYPND